MTSTALVILIGWHRPLESSFANNMELFSEVTTVCVLYMVMCFSDFVGEPATRNTCGVAFIGIVAFFLAIHLMFLIGSMCKSIYLSMHRCYLKEKREEAMQAIEARKARAQALGFLNLV